MFDDVRSLCQRLALFCLLACVPLMGCDRSTELPTELPLVEPTASDRPDPAAVALYRPSVEQTERGNSDEHLTWPQLFGPLRTGALPPRQIQLTWSDEGPPQRWSIPCGSGYGSPVASDEKVVFNHRVGDTEIVQCVDASDGKLIWEHRYETTFQCNYDYSSGPLSTPLIHDDRVYVVGGQGQFFCLLLVSGEILWSRNLHEEYGLDDDLFAVGSAPLIVDKKIVFNVGAKTRNAGIVALNLDTGETIWEATDHQSAYCSPFAATIHGQPFVFVITRFGLVSLNPRDGEIDWTIEHRSRAPMSFNAVSPMVHGDRVLAVTGPGPGVLCVQVQPDRGYVESWRDRRVLDSQYTTLMSIDDSVLGFTSAGQGGAELRRVQMETGELLWKYHSILRRGQGLVVGKAMIVLGERGHLASLLCEEDEPRVLAFTSEPLMQEPCYCSPALAGTLLYLKDEHRVACFDLSP